MSPAHHLSWNLFLATDASQYSRADNRRQSNFQADLINALTEAADAVRLHRTAWIIQPEGDGELALLPSDEPVTVVMDEFVRHLDSWLAERNRDRLHSARLRLRVGMHLGSSEKGANGFAGQAPIVVKRLLNSPQAHQALDVADEANLALIVSRHLFDDVVSHCYGSLRPEDFLEVEVRDDAKHFADTAWISVPGLAGRDLAARMTTSGIVEPQSEQSPLALAFHSEYDDPDLAELVHSTVGGEPQRMMSVEGCLAIVAHSSIRKDQVTGLWLDAMHKVLHRRTYVGISLGDPHQAAALARSSLARDTLAATAGNLMAVVVSDQAYQCSIAPGGRLVTPEAYRRVEVEAGTAWLRIPGYSFPPQPQTARSSTPASLRHSEQAHRMQVNIEHNNPTKQYFGDRFYYGGSHDRT